MAVEHCNALRSQEHGVGEITSTWTGVGVAVEWRAHPVLATISAWAAAAAAEQQACSCNAGQTCTSAIITQASFTMMQSCCDWHSRAPHVRARASARAPKDAAVIRVWEHTGYFFLSHNSLIGWWTWRPTLLPMHQHQNQLKQSVTSLPWRLCQWHKKKCLCPRVQAGKQWCAGACCV